MPRSMPERTTGVLGRTQKGAKMAIPEPVSDFLSKRGLGATSKYRNVPTVVDGKRFESKREAERYQKLALAERLGRITDLQCQVPFDLHAPNGEKIGRYIADFTYTWVAPGTATHGQRFVEDAKGVRTQLYIWKKKHAEAEHGITIIEV